MKAMLPELQSNEFSEKKILLAFIDVPVMVQKSQDTNTMKKFNEVKFLSLKLIYSHHSTILRDSRVLHGKVHGPQSMKALTISRDTGSSIRTNFEKLNVFFLLVVSSSSSSSEMLNSLQVIPFLTATNHYFSTFADAFKSHSAIVWSFLI